MEFIIPQLESFELREIWTQRALEIIKEKVLLSQGDFHIAIAGGATPLPIYRELSELSLPWNRISLYQTDERLTSDLNELNLTTQLSALGRNLLLSVHKFVTFNTDLAVTEMVNSYTKSLPDKLDLVVLGMGEDGHIMSLFCEDDLVVEGRVTQTITNNYRTKHRVGLTFDYLKKTSHILLLIQGAKKLEQLSIQLAEQTEFKPLSLLIKSSKVEILYLK